MYSSVYLEAGSEPERRFKGSSFRERQTLSNAVCTMCLESLCAVYRPRLARSVHHHYYSVQMPSFAVILVLFSTLLHATWNILAKRGSATPELFPRVLAAVAVPGLVIGLLMEWRSAALLPHIWPLVLAAGACQAAYFLGLTLGYRAGDLSLVYPLVRALPVLLIGLFDVVRGQPPGAAGWTGLLLVLGGCLLVALPAVREHPGAGAPRTPQAAGSRPGTAVGWAALAALGTVGYTVFDKFAADAITATGGMRAGAAFRYGLWEFTICAACFLPLMAAVDRGRARRQAPPQHSRAAGRMHGVLIATLMYVTYALVLWAYQLSWQTSYVVALRQFSIVLGVVVGALLLREAAPAQRIAGAVIITGGVAVLTVAGAL